MYWWPFKRKTQVQVSVDNDRARSAKVLESQLALLQAASETADAAKVVTNSLRLRLEDSFAQIESTARILNDALIICDLNGKVQAFNPSAERMFGINVEQIKDRYIGDLFTSKTHDLTNVNNVWMLLDAIDKADEIHDLAGKDLAGKTFPIDVNHTRLDRSDNSSIVLMVVRDQTPANDHYRSAFDSAFVCIIVVADDNRIVAANPVATDFFGYGVDKLLTKRLDDLVIQGKEELSEAVKEQAEVSVEGEVRFEDGETEVFFTTAPIVWNGLQATLVTIRDTTHISDIRPETENMICVFDDSFKLSFANAKFAEFYGCGYAGSDLTGCDIRDLIPAGEVNAFVLHINSLTKAKPSRRMQIQTRNMDGTFRLQVWTDHATFKEDGRIEYQRIGRDISTYANR